MESRQLLSSSFEMLDGRVLVFFEGSKYLTTGFPVSDHVEVHLEDAWLSFAIDVDFNVWFKRRTDGIYDTGWRIMREEFRYFLPDRWMRIPLMPCGSVTMECVPVIDFDRREIRGIFKFWSNVKGHADMFLKGDYDGRVLWSKYDLELCPHIGHARRDYDGD